MSLGGCKLRNDIGRPQSGSSGGSPAWVKSSVYDRASYLLVFWSSFFFVVFWCWEVFGWILLLPSLGGVVDNRARVTFSVWSLGSGHH